MSKIAILGDPHFGARGDSKEMSAHQRLFYKNVFFPYIREHGINHIVSMGDIFDRRKYINFATLKAANEMFFDVIDARAIMHTCLVGNHDIYYRNTLQVNAPSMVIQSRYTEIVSYPEQITDGVLAVPWICPDNEKQVLDAIGNAKQKILLGHFEIKGFEMYKGVPAHDGMETSVFDKFDMVLSGHFHKKSTSGNITYVGTAYEMTWSDYGDKKGFHILDTETLELTFIENPYHMFNKVWYSDETEVNMNADFSHLKDTYVKVIVTSKNDPHTFDRWVDRIYAAGPLDLQIIDDHKTLHMLSDEDIVNTTEDTRTILRKYVEGITTKVDKTKLDNLVATLYTEAMEQMDNVSI